MRYAIASISIGAVSVQPGGTGVILAGTGDPNDALDSYYGAGVLRSPDGGNTWTVMSHTADQMFSFQGEGFAGFAWSTVNPQLVVAAVSQAYEGTLVSAQLSGVSYAGLYYSTDAGASWSLATINDSVGQDVQGPQDLFASLQMEIRLRRLSGILCGTCSLPRFDFTATTSRVTGSRGPA